MSLFETAARCHVGRVRAANEDAILALPDIGLWAVADGMGGHLAGAFASRTIIEALQSIPPHLSTDLLMQRVEGAIDTAQQTLREFGRAQNPPKTAGATVVVLLSDGVRFACLWAGDSRAYRKRGDQFAQLTRDHSLVQQLVDGGLLDPAQAEKHPDSHIVTRAVGADAKLALETVQGDLRPGDTFLLCSDGLSKVMSAAQLSDALQTEDLEQAAQQLLDETLARGAPDNVSCVLVRAIKS